MTSLLRVLCACALLHIVCGERTLGYCTGTAQNLQCDWQKYAQDVGMGAAPALAVGLILLIACPLCLCGRYVCNCCGGKDQHPGCCCPQKDVQQTYSKGAIMGTKLAIVLAVLLGAVGLILLLTSSGKVSQGVDNTFTLGNKVIDDMITLANQIKAALDKINEAFARLNAQDSSIPAQAVDTSTIDTAVQSVESTRAELNRYRGDADTYDGHRHMAVLLLAIVCTVILLGGLVAALLNCRKVVPCLLLFLLFFFGFLVHFLCGTHYILGEATNDLCTEIETAGNGGGPFGGLCDDLAGDFTSLEDSSKEVEADAAESACNTLDAPGMCKDGNPLDPNEVRKFDCTGIPSRCTTFADVAALPDTVSVRADVALLPPQYLTELCPGVGAPGYTCTLRQCSTLCSGDLKTKTDAVVQLITAASDAVDLLNNEVLPLVRCDQLREKFLLPFNVPCFEASDGIKGVYVGFILMGVACIVGLIAVTLGSKRWMPFGEADGAGHKGVDSPTAADKQAADEMHLRAVYGAPVTGSLATPDGKTLPGKDDSVQIDVESEEGEEENDATRSFNTTMTGTRRSSVHY